MPGTLTWEAIGPNDSVDGEPLTAERADLPVVLYTQTCPRTLPRLALAASRIIGAVGPRVLFHGEGDPAVGPRATVRELETLHEQ